MSAGKMRHLVRLRVPADVDDGAGGQVGGFIDGPLLWVRIFDASAREQAIAGGIQTMGSHLVDLYFNTTITTSCRLRRVMPTGPALQILGIRNPDETQRMMQLDCSEAVADE